MATTGGWMLAPKRMHLNQKLHKLSVSLCAKIMQQVMALPGRNWPNCQSLLSINSKWVLLKMSGMVMSNSPLILTSPGVKYPTLNLVTVIQSVSEDKSKQREGALLDSCLSLLLSTRLSDSGHSHLPLRASLFPEQRRCRKQQTWHAAVCIPLFSGKSSHWLIEPMNGHQITQVNQCGLLWSCTLVLDGAGN